MRGQFLAPSLANHNGVWHQTPNLARTKCSGDSGYSRQHRCTDKQWIEEGLGLEFALLCRQFSSLGHQLSILGNEFFQLYAFTIISLPGPIAKCQP